MKISKAELDALYDFTRTGKETSKNKDKPGKFHATKTTIDDIKFDSGREGSRFLDLKFQLEHGYISNLRLQVPFVLIETFKYQGKTIRGVKYYADFVYMKDGKEVVEDSKGFRTPSYILKKKMLLVRYPDINFIET